MGRARKRGSACSGPPPRMQRHDAERHVAPADAAEAGLAHAPRQLVLRREAADAFVQVAIGGGVARDEAAKERQGALRIGVIGARDRRRDYLAELEAEEAAARLQHA